MLCVCTKDCFGAGGVNKRFEVGDPYEFEECPANFEVKGVRPEPVKPADDEPKTFSEIQEKNDADDAVGRPTEEELDGAAIFGE